jgi:hypothetical protein
MNTDRQNHHRGRARVRGSEFLLMHPLVSDPKKINKSPQHLEE